MALKILDNVSQIATGTGTGALEVGAAVSGAFRTMQAAGMVNGDTTRVRIQDPANPADWEIVLVTYSSGTVSRVVDADFISATGDLIDFQAGNKHVSSVLTASKFTSLEAEIAEAKALAENAQNASYAGVVYYPTLALMNGATGSFVGQVAWCGEDGNDYHWDIIGTDEWLLIGPHDPNTAAIEAIEDLLPTYDAAVVKADWSSNFLDFFKNRFIDYNADEYVTIDAYRAYSNGAIVSSPGTGRRATALIPVTRDMAVTRFGPSISSPSALAPFCFFNAAGTHLGSAYADAGEHACIYDLANAPDGTAFVAGTLTAPEQAYYVYDKKMVDFFKDMLFAAGVNPADRSGNSTGHYINKTTGARVVAGTFDLSGPMAVNANTIIAHSGGLIGDTDTTQAGYTFFDKVNEGVGITINSPAVFSKSNHGYVADDQVAITTTGALPTGLATTTNYWVIAAGLTSGVFRVSATQGGSAVNTSGTQSGVHTVRRYLGHYNPRAQNQPVKVGDHYTSATQVFVTIPADQPGPIHVLRDDTGEAETIDMVTRGSRVNYFAANLLSKGYLDANGVRTDITSATWRVCDPVPVEPTMVMYLTAFDMAAARPTVAGFDSNGTYVADIVPGISGANYRGFRVEIPAGVASVQAVCRTDTDPCFFWGVRPSQLIVEEESETFGFFDPQVVYGKLGDDVNLFPRGIVPDESISVAWAVDPPNLDTSTHSGTVTITQASPAVVTHTAHGFAADAEIKITTTGALLTGLTAGAKLYVLSTGLTTDSYRVSATRGGSAINTTGSQSGVHTAEYYNDRDSFIANEEVAILTRSATTPETRLKLRAFSRGVRTQVADILVKMSPSVPKNPSINLNIICGPGDSTTEQLDNDGTWPNELARMLIGTGLASLTVDADTDSPAIFRRPVIAADIPAAGSLSNIFFRGTRGGLTIKHEGRSGWNADKYLTTASTNSFWNAAMTPYGPTNNYKFDMEYYIENNGFDILTDPNGVNATGSNLLVIMPLGWNDIFDGDLAADASAESMSYLIDQIHSVYPDAMVWLVGLWSPPKNPMKNNSASQVRYYSKPEVFDIAVKQLGQAYRDMVAERAGPCEFYPISHVFDSEMAYNNSRRLRSRRTNYTGTADVNFLDTLQAWGSGDFVHPGSRGYSYIADALYYKILYDYCR